MEDISRRISELLADPQTLEQIKGLAGMLGQGGSSQPSDESHPPVRTPFAKPPQPDNMPDPDILIRTGGECRVSNFLLWQIAYAELFFVDKMWPDFRKDDLLEIILRYNARERRFGKTGDQLQSH